MAARCTILLAALCLPPLGVAASAQQQLAEYHDADTLSEFCGVGDVDGDGHADLAYRVSTGLVRVVSGRTQLTLHEVSGPPLEDFGSAVAGVGDIDGDGVPDLAVGATLSDVNGTDSGSVRVVSGADGTALYTVHGDAPQVRLGAKLTGLGDTNGDGVPDIGCVAADFDAADEHSRILILSGADGSTLQQCGPTYSAGEMGSSLCGPGDVNLDGFADLAACGYVSYGLVHSGVDGSLLHTIFGLIHDVSPAGDLDADGHPDLAVLDNYWGDPQGRVVSGATGDELLSVGFQSFYTQGRSFAGLGDVDGDGTPDYVLGTNSLDSQGYGLAHVYSGATGGLLMSMPLFLASGAQSMSQVYTRNLAAVGDVDGDGVTDFGAYVGGSSGWIVASARRPSRFQQLSLWSYYVSGLLAGIGTLEPDSEVSLWMTSLPPRVPTFLVIGLAALNEPFKFGHFMVPVPTILVGPLMTNASGALQLSGRWPASIPSATSFWFQGFAVDLSATGGIVSTSGLKATTP